MFYPWGFHIILWVLGCLGTTIEQSGIDESSDKALCCSETCCQNINGKHFNGAIEAHETPLEWYFTCGLQNSFQRSLTFLKHWKHARISCYKLCTFVSGCKRCAFIFHTSLRRSTLKIVTRLWWQPQTSPNVQMGPHVHEASNGHAKLHLIFRKAKFLPLHGIAWIFMQIFIQL